MSNINWKKNATRAAGVAIIAGVLSMTSLDQKIVPLLSSPLVKVLGPGMVPAATAVALVFTADFIGGAILDATNM